MHSTSFLLACLAAVYDISLSKKCFQCASPELKDNNWVISTGLKRRPLFHPSCLTAIEKVAGALIDCDSPCFTLFIETANVGQLFTKPYVVRGCHQQLANVSDVVVTQAYCERELRQNTLADGRVVSNTKKQFRICPTDSCNNQYNNFLDDQLCNANYVQKATKCVSCTACTGSYQSLTACDQGSPYCYTSDSNMNIMVGSVKGCAQINVLAKSACVDLEDVLYSAGTTFQYRETRCYCVTPENSQNPPCNTYPAKKPNYCDSVIPIAPQPQKFSKACGQKGVCVDTELGALCECVDGYTGTYCSVPPAKTCPACPSSCPACPTSPTACTTEKNEGLRSCKVNRFIFGTVTVILLLCMS